MNNDVDFEILKDEFGYFVVAARIVGGCKQLYMSNESIGAMFSLSAKEYEYYICDQYNNDGVSKNRRVHFSDYQEAKRCVRGLRELVGKAIETGNLFLSS